MRRGYLLGLLLVSCSVSSLSEEPGQVGRYQISCEGEVVYDNERPDKEHFTWFVDESAPASEQIYHNGKSVCEGTRSCNVEIKPYRIRVRTVKEGTEEGRRIAGEWDATIDRIHGIAQVKGSFSEIEGEVVKQHSLKGTYLCDRHPVDRTI